VWEHTQRYLADLDTRTVDLPSSGSDPALLGDLADDVAVLRAAVADIDGPVTVVAHSYGGVVASEALADCPNVQQIVYLAAFPLDEGESLYQVIGRQPLEWWDVHEDDNYIDVRDPAALYTDCNLRQIQQAIARLTHQSWSSLHSEVTYPAWRYLPSTYVICTRDHVLHPMAQAVLSARASEVRRLAADHSPMLSQPDVLADLLRSVICDPAGPYRG
jgi:pimeloyl-ACP methyl ester carboxylesterase